MIRLISILLALCLSIGVRADLVKLNANYSRTVLMTASSDHITGLAGLTLTITASNAGGAFASVTPTVTDLGSGWYKLALTSVETAILGTLNMHITGASADPTDTADQIVAFDPTVATNLGLTALPTANPATAGGLITDGSGAGQLNPNGSGGLASISTVASGTAQAGGASSITLAVSGSSATTDYYKGDYVLIVSGTGGGQARTVTAYNGGTQVCTLSRAWTVNPDNTSVYAVVANPHPALDSNLAVLVQSGTGTDQVNLSGGNLAGPVPSVTAAVVLPSNAPSTFLANTTAPANFISTSDGADITAFWSTSQFATLGGMSLNAPYKMLNVTSNFNPWNELTSNYAVTGSFGKGLGAFLVGAPSGWLVSDTATLNAISTNLLGQTIETGITLKQAMEILGSYAAGNVVGSSATAGVYGALGNSGTPRITYSLAPNGTRTITISP